MFLFPLSSMISASVSTSVISTSSPLFLGEKVSEISVYKWQGIIILFTKLLSGMPHL
jgi:hypothetical protein